jgi:hypothetical protein
MKGMKKPHIIAYSVALSGIAVLALAHAASAEEVRATANVQLRGAVAASSTLRNDLKEKRDDLKELASSTRAEIRATASTTRAEIKATASSTRAELKAEIRIKANLMLQDRIAKVKAELAREASTLDSLAERISAQFSKLQEKGVDTTAAQAGLDAAKAKIADAKVSIGSVASITASTTDPRATLDALKTATEAARTAIRDAREALVSVVKSLKASIEARVQVQATSTDSR